MSNSAQGLLGGLVQGNGKVRLVEKDNVATQRDTVLWGLIVLALVLRTVLPFVALALNHDASVFIERDTPDYVQPAQALLTSHEFYKAGHPAIERTPGFPLLLLPGLATGHLEAVTIALQIFLGTLTVFFVYLTAKELFSRTAAYWCAGLYAIEPLAVLYSSQLMSETLFTFLAVVFLYLSVRYIKQGKLQYLLTGTVALAAATYVRPVSYYLPFVLVFIVFYAACQMHRRSTALFHALAFFLFYFALVGPWQVRNYRLTGYNGFTSVGDVNLYFNQGVSIIAKKSGRAFYDVQQEAGYYSSARYEQSHPDQKNWSATQKYAYMHREGSQLIRQNLFTYSLIHLKGMVVVMADAGGIDYAKLFKKYPSNGTGLLGSVTDKGILSGLNTVRTQYPLGFYLVLCFTLMLLCYTALAASGIVLGWQHSRTATIFLVTVGLYFLVLSGGPMATGRYRHPIMPIVCIFAGYALARGSRALGFLGDRVGLEMNQQTQDTVYQQT